MITNGILTSSFTRRVDGSVMILKTIGTKNYSIQDQLTKFNLTLNGSNKD